VTNGVSFHVFGNKVSKYIVRLYKMTFRSDSGLKIVKIDYFNIKFFSINRIIINKSHYFKIHDLSRNNFSKVFFTSL